MVGLARARLKDRHGGPGKDDVRGPVQGAHLGSDGRQDEPGPREAHLGPLQGHDLVAPGARQHDQAENVRHIPGDHPSRLRFLNDAPESGRFVFGKRPLALLVAKLLDLGRDVLVDEFSPHGPGQHCRHGAHGAGGGALAAGDDGPAMFAGLHIEGSLAGRRLRLPAGEVGRREVTGDLLAQQRLDVTREVVAVDLPRILALERFVDRALGEIEIKELRHGGVARAHVEFDRLGICVVLSVVQRSFRPLARGPGRPG